jgi:hypothetical protein
MGLGDPAAALVVLDVGSTGLEFLGPPVEHLQEGLMVLLQIDGMELDGRGGAIGRHVGQRTDAGRRRTCHHMEPGDARTVDECQLIAPIPGPLPRVAGLVSRPAGDGVYGSASWGTMTLEFSAGECEMGGQYTGQEVVVSPAGYGLPRYREQSQAMAVFVLGLLGMFVFPPLAPFAWAMGNREFAAIDAGRRPPDSRHLARIGQVLGIIMSLLLILFVVLVVALIAVSL